MKQKIKKTRMTRTKFIKFVEGLDPCPKGLSLLKRRLKNKPVRALIIEYASMWQLWMRGKIESDQRSKTDMGSDFNWLINSVDLEGGFEDNGGSDIGLVAADRHVDVVVGAMLAAVERVIASAKKLDDKHGVE